MALSNEPLRPKIVPILLVLMMLSSHGEGRSDPFSILQNRSPVRKLFKLVEEPATILTYHNGPIMSASESVPVFVIWYGDFAESQKSIVRDFFGSFQSPQPEAAGPSVSSWWKPTRDYKDASGSSIPSQVHLAAELSDGAYSKGKSLKNADLEQLIIGSVVDVFPANPHGFYLVLTAEDVQVEDFCKSSCASHFATRAVAATSDRQLPFGWVGNAAKQCAGRCSWPFAKPEYGPQTAPLLAPNGDVGMDGVIMNIATILAGAFTNPFGTGFYQGDGSAPLEAATACPGIFGVGAYPGFPGQLSQDVITGTSFNALGVNDRRFLLPALWDPSTLKCAYPA
ncbi:hypothetical protein Mapa_014210 [Marchantia paleacea]|nr:hypothetical protein Mapa_014210 [Marchantia paleacea]